MIAREDGAGVASTALTRSPDVSGRNSPYPAPGADGEPAGGPHRSIDPSCPRGCAGHGQDRLLTSASVVTLVRTVACVALGLAGIATSRPPLLLAALGVYWVGDVLDGALARHRDEETITGAVLDIVNDRVCVAVVYLGYVSVHPEFAAALGVYLLEFLVIDSALSLTFLRWPLSSPNYFHLVDRLIWRLNWWPPAKVANSALPALLCAATGMPGPALVAAVVLLVLKTLCLARVTTVLGARGERCSGHPR